MSNSPIYAAMKHRIAILFHERQRDRSLDYLINRYAELWRADGNEVVPVFGVSRFEPADLVIVHVDLSVVPDEYLEFAQRYPIVLNGGVKDIRKSAISRLLVKPGDAYAGRVIVKSDYNYAGIPERILGVATDPGGYYSSFFESPLDYQIFENLQVVPQVLLDDPNIVVEKFQPEMENGLFFMRAMLFLGDRVSCARMASRQPIVNGTTQLYTERIEPHPEMVALRKAMQFDYGKFDYVIHDGRPLLLDANKTVGAATIPSNPEREAARRYRAEGLYGYFGGVQT